MLEEVSKELRIKKVDLMKAIGLDPLKENLATIEGQSLSNDIILRVVEGSVQDDDGTREPA